MNDDVKHLIVLTGVVVFILGLLVGYSVAQLDARDTLQRGYAHGYIDALTGTRDPDYWHHVTITVHDR